jgi:hypothetical protein
VPVVLAVATGRLAWEQRRRQHKDEAERREREARAAEAQRKRELEVEEAQRKRELEVEEAQRKRELEVEEARAQDQALEAYLDDISQLLTDEKRPLSRARLSDNLSTMARARTLTTLARLDGSRKRSVLQFLYESGLVIKDRVVVDLRGADLSNAHLSAANLRDDLLPENWSSYYESPTAHYYGHKEDSLWANDTPRSRSSASSARQRQG